MGSLELDTLEFGVILRDNFFRNLVTEMQVSLNTEVVMKQY